MVEKIKALTWDFGGVLLRTEDPEPRRLWEQRLNLQPGELHDIVFMGEASRKATVGRATTEDIWRAVGKRLELDPPELEELRRDFWSGDRLDTGLVNATRALREHLKTALLSNAWPDLRPYLENDLGLDGAFDVLVISAEEGTAKPDAEIYRLLLDRLKVPAGACVFIDDNLENVQAAQSAGIYSILFRNREQTLRELRAILPPELTPLLDV